MKTPDINAILRADPRSGKYGAPMGCSNWDDSTGPLYLQRVRFVDGDYGADGTYWGGGRGSEPLWCAFNGDDAEHKAGHGTRIYVRAKSRAEAMALILEDHDVSFRRSK